jgi:hypothetical protein
VADAERAEPERGASGGSKIHRTRAAEVIDAASESVSRVARLTPQQVLTVIAVGILGFVCTMQAFQTWSDRQERKEVARERQDAAAAQIRESNAQAELSRQSCERRERDLQSFFATEGDKNRAVLTALAAEVADLKRAIGKKGGAGD